MEMRRKLIVVIAIVAVVAVLVAAPVMAKKPLEATTTHDFMGGHMIVRPISDDVIQLLGWQGTITGDINGCAEWWFNIPPGIVATGQASHYNTTTEVHEGACPETPGPSTGDVILAAEGSGTTTARHMKNSNWRANATVTFATGDYAGWLGRNIHESGHFEWQNLGTEEEPDWAPLRGESIFRIN